MEFLPGTGRWQSAGLTEGAGRQVLHPSTVYHASTGPSTTLQAVPLPVPGRIWLRPPSFMTRSSQQRQLPHSSQQNS
jgi:hypothetical protein